MAPDDASACTIDPAGSVPVARAVLEATDSLVLVLDANGRIQYLNPACEARTGYAAGELRGAVFFNALLPERECDEARAYWEQFLDGHAEPRYRSHCVTKDGDRLYVTWSNARVRTEDGRRYVVATGTDVTRQRELERDVVSVSESERQRIGQELHDTLASDLVAAAMQLDNLQEHLGSPELSPEEVRQRLDRIENSVREASRQARSLSHLLVAGDVSPPELPGALSELVETYREAVGTDCALSLPEDEVPALVDDTEAGHLYRIAQEAVRNAVQHGDPDHVTVQLEIRTPSSPEEAPPKPASPDRDGRRLVLRVQDDGTGLPEAVSTCMAEAAPAPPGPGPRRGADRDVAPRSEASCSRKTLTESPDADGIGLHLMRYRADLIGADLSVRSAEGEGTVVCCVLPLD